MLARLCECDRPRLLEPPACHRCGRDTAPRVSASTWRLALAIARAAIEPAGLRRTPDAVINEGTDHG